MKREGKIKYGINAETLTMKHGQAIIFTHCYKLTALISFFQFTTNANCGLFITCIKPTLCKMLT